jgi:prolyl oligopeptidase
MRLPAPLLAVCLGCASQSPSVAGGPAGTSVAPPDAGPVAAVEGQDPYLWLEEVTGEKPLQWVKGLDEKALGELTPDPRFAPLQARLRAILDSKDRIPAVVDQAGRLYNFWRDEAHPRGLWRRVPSLAEYRKASPAWEPVLDLDALAAAEKENWVWKGAACLYPRFERCLLKLSRGGADAVVVREFDAVKKAFVAGGFVLPEAKSEVAWRDLDTLFLGTDLGPTTLTDSGYPRQVRLWKRGTPPASAPVLYEGRQADVAVSGGRSWDHGKTYDFVQRATTFFSGDNYLLAGDKLVKLDVPETVKNVDVWDGQLLLTLRDDWETGGKTWPKGSLLATPLADFLAGKRAFTSLYTPSPSASLVATAPLKTALVVVTLEDVKNKATVWTRRGTAWKQGPVDAVQGLVSFGLTAVKPGDADELWLEATDFTLPSTLSLLKLGQKPEALKHLPAFFDATGLAVTQHFATSKDGTRVPYYQVARQDLALDGSAPTLLTGYGGFEVPLEAYYSPTVGAAWLEQGGVFVQANIRGGGEYGPGWHQAALKEKRQNAYDDFIAIAEDLVARKVTSPAKLGIQGGSNGGLLMGVMLTQRPDLFGAVVCQVPLLDMKRYSQLLAGASWMGEYGDPSKPEDWAYLSAYSPYQNVRAGRSYPRTLFMTSTRDDRVHPGHARKMVARMLAQGHDVLYYENTEGGHGGAANNEQRAKMSALAFTFLARQLGLAAHP